MLSLSVLTSKILEVPEYIILGLIIHIPQIVWYIKIKI